MNLLSTIAGLSSCFAFAAIIWVLVSVVRLQNRITKARIEYNFRMMDEISKDFSNRINDPRYALWTKEQE